MTKDLKVKMKKKFINKIFETQWREIKKIVQDMKVEVKSVKKRQTEGKLRIKIYQQNRSNGRENSQALKKRWNKWAPQ